MSGRRAYVRIVDKAASVFDVLVDAMPNAWGGLTLDEISDQTGLNYPQVRSAVRYIKYNHAPQLGYTCGWNPQTRTYQLTIDKADSFAIACNRLDDLSTRALTIEKGALDAMLQHRHITPRLHRSLVAAREEFEDMRDRVNRVAV